MGGEDEAAFFLSLDLFFSLRLKSLTEQRQCCQNSRESLKAGERETKAMVMCEGVLDLVVF